MLCSLSFFFLMTMLNSLCWIVVGQFCCCTLKMPFRMLCLVVRCQWCKKIVLVGLEVDVIVVVDVDVDAYDLLSWLLPKSSAESCCVMHPLLFWGLRCSLWCCRCPSCWVAYSIWGCCCGSRCPQPSCQWRRCCRCIFRVDQDASHDVDDVANLRWAQASHQHHVVVVAFRCAVVRVWYCTHVVFLVVWFWKMLWLSCSCKIVVVELSLVSCSCKTVVVELPWLMLTCWLKVAVAVEVVIDQVVLGVVVVNLLRCWSSVWGKLLFRDVPLKKSTRCPDTDDDHRTRWRCPHLKEVGNGKLVDGLLLLAVVVKVVIASNVLLHAVVAVVLDDLVLLNLIVIVVDDLSRHTSCCRCVSRCCCFHSSLPMLLSKTLLWNNFYQRTLVEQLIGGNVVPDAVLPFVLLDVEHDVVVELCEVHSLDVRSCCSRCRCRSSFHILLSNFLLRSSSQMMLVFPFLLDFEDTLDVERLVVHSPVVRSCSSKALFSISLMWTSCCDANFLLNNLSISSLLFLLFCGSFAWVDEVVALLGVVNPFLYCQVLLFKPLLSTFLLRTLLTKHSSSRYIAVVGVGGSAAPDSDVVAQLLRSLSPQLLRSLSPRWPP